MLSSPEGYAIAVVTIAVFSFMLRWMSRHQRFFLDEAREMIDDQKARIDQLERDNWRCLTRQDLLLRAIRDLGGDVPRQFWEDVS